MPKPLSKVLEQIEKKRTPPVILIGGSSEFLAERAFHALRDAILSAHPGIKVEWHEPGADLVSIIDSYRTHSLFGGARLVVVPEVNAFVSAKELNALFEKAVADWKSAKTDRKRATASAKLLHVLGLAGADLEMTDAVIAQRLGAEREGPLPEMLAFCRSTGRKAGRGEDDAALLMEAIARGGAPGTLLLLRTGEIPQDSSTVEIIDQRGAVVVADVTRERFISALEEAVSALAAEWNVRFEPAALARLRASLGIDRILGDKFSRELPDLRMAVSEAERLITLAGEGGRVTAEVVHREVQSLEGGARYELASLFTEGKFLEAVQKLRDLVAQSRREDPRVSLDILYGRYLFPLADEIRQMIAIRSFARARKLDLRAPLTYNRFRDSIAEPLGESMKRMGLVRQRPHPFPLHKKWEAAALHSDKELFETLALIADLDLKRKSGGLPVDISLETFLLSRVRAS